MAAVLLFINQGTAQNGFFDLLNAGEKDASKYAGLYVAPIFKGFGYGFNTGWYTTAKPHKTLGLDISLSASLAYVPSSDQYFTFKNSDYSSLQLANGTEAKTPTLFGPNQPGPDVKVVDHNTTFGDVTLADFSAPKGAGLKKEIGFNAVPTPVLQLGIGLIKNTDLKIRYVPDFSSSADYTMWGIGLMHDITQWIPVVDKLPIDISIFGCYSNLKVNWPMSANDTNFPGSNQALSTGIKAYSIEALISKKVSVLTVYAGIGYSKAKTYFNVLGTYELTYNPTTPPPVGYTLPTPVFTDPISVNTKNGGMKLTAGLRLQFAILTLHADYSLMGYNVLNTGIGFTFR